MGIETCNADTELIRIRIVMNFYDAGRLVLVGPADGPVYANWDFDDPDHPDGNILLIGYSNFLYPDTDTNNIQRDIEPPGDIVFCDDTFGGDLNEAYIAQVPNFKVVRQRFGSYGIPFRKGEVYGFLDHRPFVSPAVVGKVRLYRY